ncbi:MAG: hypothetical protein LC808_36655 [Actinobacteria bacterium]|nr:hypothetical protein [Actinomycetota bacterium]
MGLFKKSPGTAARHNLDETLMYLSHYYGAVLDGRETLTDLDEIERDYVRVVREAADPVRAAQGAKGIQGAVLAAERSWKPSIGDRRAGTDYDLQLRLQRRYIEFVKSILVP